MDGWNTTFLLGRLIFRCYVSFSRRCISSPFRSPPNPPIHLPFSITGVYANAALQRGVFFSESFRYPKWRCPVPYWGGVGGSLTYPPYPYNLHDGFRMNPPFGWYLPEMFGEVSWFGSKKTLGSCFFHG